MLKRVKHWAGLFTQSFISLLKIPFLSRFSISFPTKPESSDSLIVIGNGPSFILEYESNPEFFRNTSLFVVNYFASTDHYQKLKPQFYLVNDSSFYALKKNKFLLESRSKLFHPIIEKTTWPLSLFLPYSAKNDREFLKEIRKNGNITIYFFNKTAIEGFRCLRHFLFRKKLGLPRPHNVLIPSITHSINLAFKYIYLTGVDHSWLSECKIDEENCLLINPKHYYDSANSTHKKYIIRYKHRAKYHDFLLTLYHTFRSYHFLEEYSQSRNCKIYNLTGNSFIDAFERRDISSLKD